QFIALAEKISGQQLDTLFQTWLFTTTKPVLSNAARVATTQAPAAALSLIERQGQKPVLRR
ncbi:MAG TPA: hypothetical protein VFI00_13665, partial [Kribbella sp.]|nr:hypothetical protein [Kribbella sp.]